LKPLIASRPPPSSLSSSVETAPAAPGHHGRPRRVRPCRHHPDRPRHPARQRAATLHRSPLTDHFPLLPRRSRARHFLRPLAATPSNRSVHRLDARPGVASGVARSSCPARESPRGAAPRQEIVTISPATASPAATPSRAAEEEPPPEKTKWSSNRPDEPARSRRATAEVSGGNQWHGSRRHRRHRRRRRWHHRPQEPGTIRLRRQGPVPPSQALVRPATRSRHETGPRLGRQGRITRVQLVGGSGNPAAINI
jgi:hypothetical protein